MQKYKEILKRLTHFFNQPFPEEINIQTTIKTAVIVSIFIFLFLYSFRPFGLHLVGEDILLFSFYFAVITFIITVLYDFLLIYLLKVKTNLPSWTLGKWFISVLGLITLISIANAFLMLKLNPNSHFSTMHFLLNLKATFLIGIFPLLFFGSLIVSKRTKENANIADSIHVKPRQLEIENENKIVIDMNGQNLYIRVEDFVLAEAMQNYVTIYHLNNEQQIIKTTFRSTLKSFLEKVNDHQVLQSHRSYIVNCVHIKDVSGNAQGLKLELQNTDIIVPVSRKYIPLFRSKFN